MSRKGAGKVVRQGRANGKTGKGELLDYRAKVRGRRGREVRRAGGRWKVEKTRGQEGRERER